MKEAGVRDVKNHLSEYLRRVRRGAVVRITDRGVVVAELRPPSPAADGDAAYESLLAEGKVVAPTRPFTAALVTIPRNGPRLPAGVATELIDADRADMW